MCLIGDAARNAFHTNPSNVLDAKREPLFMYAVVTIFSGVFRFD